MQLSTIRAIINSFNVASDDDTRFHLCHVSLTAEGEDVVLKATQGHTLSVVRVRDEEAAKLVDKTLFAVSRDDLPLLKLMAKNKSPLACESKLDGDTLVLSMFGVVCRINTARYLNIQFPDFRQVIPTLKGDEFTVGLNPRLLMELFKALNSEKRHEGVTLIFSSNPMNPITVDHDGQRGVLMPMRTDLASKYVQEQAEKAAQLNQKKGA